MRTASLAGNEQSSARHFLISKRRLRSLLALAIIALGFGLRLYRVGGESLWYDELLQLDIAQGPLNSLLPRLRGHTAVPLDYLITHLWIQAGRSEAWVRLPAVVWGILTLPLIFRLGRRLINPATGLLVMLLLAVSPFHVQYSQEVRPYALLVLGVVLSGLAYWRLRKSSRWLDLILLQSGILIAFLSHVFAVPVWVALLTFAGLDLLAGPDRKRRFQALIGLLATGLVALAVLLALGWGEVLFYNTAGFGEALLRPEVTTPKGTAAVSVSSRSPQPAWPLVRNEILAPLGTHGGTDLSWWLLNILAGLGLISLLAGRRFRSGLLLLFWLGLPPLLIVTFLIYRSEFFASRYILSTLPAYLLLLAAGLDGLSRVGSKRLGRLLFVLATGCTLVVMGLGLNRLYYQPDKEDWRLVTEFIAANAGPTDAVIAFRAEPALNWYYPRARAVPNSYGGLEAVRQAVARAGRSWVILSLFSSDSDATIKAWLSEQQAVRFDLDPLIQVYYLGQAVSSDQLLTEIEQFALPVDHALYASLARENRRRPEIARRYYQLAIENAPDAGTRARYQAALEGLGGE